MINETFEKFPPKDNGLNVLDFNPEILIRFRKKDLKKHLQRLLQPI